MEEATAGGKLLKEGGFDFDVAYTSTLKRAIKTLWIVLEQMDLMYIPIVSKKKRNIDWKRKDGIFFVAKKCFYVLLLLIPHDVIVLFKNKHKTGEYLEIE